MSLANGNSKGIEALDNKRIFIVEDNLENRIILQLALVKSSATLEFDRWGRDTIQRLNGFMPTDLILLDLMLPHGISGYDIFDQIRQKPAFAKIPIVALSAADPNQAIPKCRMKGFAGFIAKPIDDDLFAEQLAKILRGEKVWYNAQQ
jgi:CheY-like chemotaxis protein